MIEERIGEIKLGEAMMKAGMSTPETPYEKIPYLLDAEEERIAELQAFVAKNDARRWKTSTEEVSNGILIDIPLTEEERAESLKTANKRKWLKQAHEEAMKRGASIQKEKEEAVKKEWDAVRFLRLMRAKSQERYGKKLLETPDKLGLIKALCFRLAKDARYENELGLSFSKGLIIRGAPGLGKSFMPGLIADNPISKIQILTMPKIISTVRKFGYFEGMNFGDYGIIYFDDVGTEFEAGEGVVKYMGTPINWFKQYIEDYYANFPGQFHRLMFSTNDNFETLESKYGYRVRDRLAEMFDVVDISGNSMRRN